MLLKVNRKDYLLGAASGTLAMAVVVGMMMLAVHLFGQRQFNASMIKTHMTMEEVEQKLGPADGKQWDTTNPTLAFWLCYGPLPSSGKPKYQLRLCFFHDGRTLQYWDTERK